MMRWTYLLTRLFILALIVVAIWISKDSLVRLALIRAGESAIGAKIEIGQVRSSLWDGKIYLSELAIADPRNPMHNLVQADISYLVLNPNRLLHRELVIEKGSSTQVRFGAPRTLSGALEDSSSSQPKVIANREVGSRPNKYELSRRWLEQFAFLPKGLAQGYSEDKLTTYQISHDLVEKWEPLMQAQRQELVRLQNKIQNLQKATSIEISNPLRDHKRVVKAKQQMQQAQEQIKTLQAKLVELNVVANSDLVKLEDAKDVDLKNIASLVGANQFDSELVSGQLLQQHQVAYTREIIDWFRWFRDSIPDPSQDFDPALPAGIDFKLSTTKPRPSFLLKHMDLDGEGKVAGQHFNFSGFAKNISNQPHFHDQPSSFHLRAQGETHLIVDCTLDRRDETWIDSLDILCPNLSLPAQTIGDKDSLLVKMTPCRMETDIHIKMEGENLSGNMVFRHTDLMMQIENMKTLSGGFQMADEINLDLAGLDQFEIRAELQGTIDEPEILIHSDLGTRFAAIMNRIAQKKAGKRLADYRAKITEINHEHVDGMNQFVIKGLDEMLGQLKGYQTTAAQLKTQIPNNLDASEIRR